MLSVGQEVRLQMRHIRTPWKSWRMSVDIFTPGSTEMEAVPSLIVLPSSSMCALAWRALRTGVMLGAEGPVPECLQILENLCTFLTEHTS